MNSSALAARSGRLRATVVPVSQLSSAHVDAMWSLFDRYYADVDRRRFEADLAQKQRIVLLSDSGDGSVQGFSTIQVLEGEAGGKPYRALYSGDTVCDRAYWGQKTLNRQFLLVLLGEKLRHPLVPFYWFLISKGYKTYLLLARNFPDCWPRRDVAVPEREAEILDQIATKKFGAAWRPEQGILRFDVPLGRLKEAVAPIEGRVLEDPDIRFFAERNPGHLRGDELCCLGAVNLRFVWFNLQKYLVPWAATRRAAKASTASAARVSSSA